MDLGLRSKCAIVTGGSRAIGRAIACALADEGANIGIFAYGADALRDTARARRERGVEVVAGVCDIGDPAALDGFLESVHAAFEGVDILVNNASALAASFADDEAGWRSSFDVDVMASVRATWKVVPWMAPWRRVRPAHLVRLRPRGRLAASLRRREGGPHQPFEDTGDRACAAEDPRQRDRAGIDRVSGRAGGIGPQARPGVSCVGARDDSVGTNGHRRRGGRRRRLLVSARASWIMGVCLGVDGGQRKANI